MWINISKSGNSFMTGSRCNRGKKEVFSQGILRKNNNHVAVDVFIYVFVNEAPRIGNGGVERARGEDNVLNNTTNYTATFFLCVGRTDLNIYYLHKHLVS